MTALNDAICCTIHNKLKTERKNGIIMIVITDGEDNASQKYTNSDVKDYIEKEYNWNVIFCGANIDAITEGSSRGVNPNMCFEFNKKTKGNLLNLCRNVSECVSDCRTYRMTDNTAKLNLTRAGTEPPTRLIVNTSTTEFPLPIPTLKRM